MTGDIKRTGEDLAALRRKNKISQELLGVELGYGRTGIYHMERVKVAPTEWFEEYEKGIKAILERKLEELN